VKINHKVTFFYSINVIIQENHFFLTPLFKGLFPDLYKVTFKRSFSSFKCNCEELGYDGVDVGREMGRNSDDMCGAEKGRNARGGKGGNLRRKEEERKEEIRKHNKDRNLDHF
jgi:hypothetical protein